MRDHSLIIDRSVSPARIAYAPVFNVAVPFIDRHLDEGRGDKVAIRADAGDVTYRTLAEKVNRCGNAFRSLGLAPGDRILLVVKDCAEFFYAFWGAIKAGYVPAPLNTLLRAHDYA
jgi:acyl-coenzyme A synthetase/AMP-(fatty) acid ligase